MDERIVDDKNAITFMTGIEYGTANFTELDLGDYLFYVADIVVSGVQYGHRTDMCDIFTREADPHHADLGVPAYTIEMKAFAVDIVGVTLDAYNRADPAFYKFKSSAYPWTYQFCTEFGWY